MGSPTQNALRLGFAIIMDVSVLKGALQNEAIVEKVLETGRVFFTSAGFTVNAFPLLLYSLVSLALIAPFLLNLLEAPEVGYGAPTEEYGAPTSEYGAPSQEYGAPSAAYSADSLLRRRDPLEAIEALERKLSAMQDVYYNNGQQQQGVIRSSQDIDYNSV